MVVLVSVFISGLDIPIHSSYIFAFSIYFINNLNFKKNLSKERWTIDEAEDFVVIKNIFNYFKNRYDFSWTEILKLKFNQY